MPRPSSAPPPESQTLTTSPGGKVALRGAHARRQQTLAAAAERLRRAGVDVDVAPGRGVEGHPLQARLHAAARLEVCAPRRAGDGLLQHVRLRGVADDHRHARAGGELSALDLSGHAAGAVGAARAAREGLQLRRGRAQPYRCAPRPGPSAGRRCRGPSVSVSSTRRSACSIARHLGREHVVVAQLQLGDGHRVVFPFIMGTAPRASSTSSAEKAL